MNSIDRFIKYAKINTQSSDKTGTTPSTECQKDLARILVQELLELGLNDAHMDKYGNVYAHLEGEGDKVGLNAHMDTALEVTDVDVNPKFVKFDGNDVVLSKECKLSIKEFPQLKKHIGHSLIVTDGTTLLGADDKAGIGIIVSALEFFKNNPNVKHKNISVAFTVDEEIGEGALHFDLNKMNADYAYTIDGSNIDCIDYENFNAKKVNITIKGVSIHPGEGKNALINAILVGKEILNKLPQNETPFDSSDDQGYWHVTDFSGTSETASIEIILRDFDKKNIENRVKDIEFAIDFAKNIYKTAQINYNIKDQYFNMKEYVEKNKKVVELAEDALRKNGLTPKHTKIRGGTDGATLSKMGLTTPNLGTGSYNHHGRFEYLDVEEYNKMIDVVIDILKE